MKTLFLLVFAVFSPLSSQAQITSESYAPASAPTSSFKGLKLIAKVGPGISDMTFDDKDKATGMGTRTGAYLAAEVEFPITSKISFLTGLDYVQKGMAYSSTFTDSNGVDFNADGQLEVNYLLIPLEAKLNLPFKGVGMFNLSAGPYLAFALYRNSSMTVSNSVTSQEFNQSEASNISVVDAGARFGAALEIPVIRNIDLTVGANYDLGLMNINVGQDSDSLTLKTGTFIASVGAVFHL